MKRLFLLILFFTLSACGHTTSIKNSENSKFRINISHYDTLIINDFKDHTSQDKNNHYVISEGARLADLILNYTKSKNIFITIKRNIYSNEPALLVDGNITELNEGNQVARLLIGLGAGSSHFDADIFIKDNQTKKVLGTMQADKMSWGLGGAIAASQDVKSHMIDVAEKVAYELYNAKRKPSNINSR